MPLASTAAFVPLTLLLLTKQMEYEYSTGKSPFSEIDLCRKPCSCELSEKYNDVKVKGAHYYFANNNTCGHTDVSIKKDLITFYVEDGTRPEPIPYPFKCRDGCFIHDEGFHIVPMELKSCEAMFAIFSCNYDGGVRIYILFGHEKLTDECFDRGYDELKSYGLVLPKKDMKACSGK